MRTIVNHEELKKEWVIEKWYEKMYYVVGVLFTWWMIVAFTFGFLVGVAESL